jgi:hypothetical protein
MAYRNGVTTSVTAPISSGLISGVSTAFSTGAESKLAQGAVLRDWVALHFAVTMSMPYSVSTQIATLRHLLLSPPKQGEVLMGDMFEYSTKASVSANTRTRLSDDYS